MYTNKAATVLTNPAKKVEEFPTHAPRTVIRASSVNIIKISASILDFFIIHFLL